MGQNIRRGLYSIVFLKKNFSDREHLTIRLKYIQTKNRKKYFQMDNQNV